MNRCKIKIHEGKVVIGKENVRDLVRSKKDGYYNLKIEKWEDSRSLQQNRLYWQWLTIIGEELGYTKSEMHEVMLDQFAPKLTFRGLDGKPKQRKIRTSEMTIKQMHEYMDTLDRWSAEMSIILPQPDDELIASIIETFDAEEA